MITSDKDNQNKVEGLLKNLHKGEAIVYGPIKRENGNLSIPEYHSTKIMSFEERENLL